MTRFPLALFVVLSFAAGLPVFAQAPRTPTHLSGGPTYHMGGVAADGARASVLFSNAGLVYVSTSDDCGGDWSPLVRIDSDPDRRDKWANSVDGESVHVHGDHVYAAWQDGRLLVSRELWFGRSIDGGGSFADGSLGVVNPGSWVMKVVRAPASSGPTGDRIHLLAQADDPANPLWHDLVLVTSTDGGATFGAPADASVHNGTATANVRQVALHAEGNRVVVAWVDERSGDLAAYVRASTDGGATFGAELRLSAPAGGLVNNFIHVAGEADVIAVGWLELESSGTDSVHVRVSGDGGATFGPDTVVGDYTPGVADADAVRLVVVGGNVVCAWNDDRHGDSAIFVATSIDGGGTFSESLLSATTGYHFNPRLAADGARIALIWKNNSPPRGVGSSHSTDAGLTWSTPLVVSSGTDNGNQAVLAMEGDQVHVAWLANYLSGNAYDSYVGGYDLTQAAVADRTAGTNVQSYTATPPVLGQTWTATVELATTGHDFAVVRIQAATGTVPLSTGDVFLLGGPFLFRTPLLPGPLARYQTRLPTDPCLSGLTPSSQALHLGGVLPFALSNAQDLTIGSY